MTIWDDVKRDMAEAFDARFPANVGAVSGDLPIEKLAIHVPISEAMLNPPELTAEERARWAAVTEADRVASARRLRRHGELAGSTNRVVAVMAELHAPVGDAILVCLGCDSEGFHAEPADWPCRTWLLLDETVEAA